MNHIGQLSHPPRSRLKVLKLRRRELQANEIFIGRSIGTHRKGDGLRQFLNRLSAHGVAFKYYLQNKQFFGQNVPVRIGHGDEIGHLNPVLLSGGAALGNK